MTISIRKSFHSNIMKKKIFRDKSCKEREQAAYIKNYKTSQERNFKLNKIKGENIYDYESEDTILIEWYFFPKRATESISLKILLFKKINNLKGYS